MKRIVPVIVAFLLCWTAHGKMIPAKNWEKNPDTIEVKKVYQANQTATRKYKKESKKWSYCEPYADMERTIYRDDKKVARIYVHSGGSDDSSLTFESHYDENGKLRFVFIMGGAVNGSQLEHRIYYRANGERFWQIQKYTKGEGYTFPTDWPEDEITKDPEAALKAKHPCDKQRL